jgi:hypothetical protein
LLDKSSTGSTDGTPSPRSYGEKVGMRGICNPSLEFYSVKTVDFSISSLSVVMPGLDPGIHEKDISIFSTVRIWK